MLRLHLSLHCCCTCLLMLEKAKIGSVMSGEAEKRFFLSLPVCSHFQYFYHQLRSPFKEKQTLRLFGAWTFYTDDKSPSDSWHFFISTSHSRIQLIKEIVAQLYHLGLLFAQWIFLASRINRPQHDLNQHPHNESRQLSFQSQQLLTTYLGKRYIYLCQGYKPDAYSFQ